jgi:hypothetical protein
MNGFVHLRVRRGRRRTRGFTRGFAFTFGTEVEVAQV